MFLKKPKILVFTVSSWNRKVGANTWEALLHGYGSENVANICIRDEIPESTVCSRYFCVSENKILKSIFNRKVKTGREVFLSQNDASNNSDLVEHNLRYQKYRNKRKYSLLMLRELIWKIGKWKTKELETFLMEFQPDIILYSLEGYIHFSRIVEYAIVQTGARAIGYIWDDNFTYKQSSAVGYKVYRFFQRKSLKRLVKKTQAFFAITPKTKREADVFFGINCEVLSKPLNAFPIFSLKSSKPINILYTGNLSIGRDRTLQKVIRVAAKIQGIEKLVQISVYTQTQFKENELACLNCSYCHIYSAITQEEVLKKQKEADVLLFLEDINGKNAKTARLSFSTKLTDYLSSGKCIFAIGNDDLAPIEYLRENEAALVACSEDEIEAQLKTIVSNGDVLQKYARTAINCGLKNHHPDIIIKTFYNVIEQVIRDQKNS